MKEKFLEFLLRVAIGAVLICGGSFFLESVVYPAFEVSYGVRLGVGMMLGFVAYRLMFSEW